MAKIYWMADDGVKALVADVMHKWHADLTDAQVRIGVIMAHDPSGKAAVTHGGYRALATIRIVPLKDRVSKGYDAELLIDADDWKSSAEPHKLALLDHELMHLEVKRAKVKDKKKDDLDEIDDELGKLETVETVPVGEIIRDDIGRPVLKLRKGDWNGGDGFEEVAARHGQFSIEVLNHRSVGTVVEQYMKGGENDAQA